MVAFLCKEIFQGRSPLRALLNMRLAQEELVGKVIDIGGGRDADYISFMPRAENVTFETFDVKAGASINFETDRLPAEDNSYDTVLFLNVMEHIFNYQHIAGEVVRITKKDGQLIGFVPFLMWYHPDHSDYFRYTHEALTKIFTKAGAKHISIEPIARGPFVASFHMYYSSIPRLIRVPFFLFNHALDAAFLYVRPGHGERYALGYFFILR